MNSELFILPMNIVIVLCRM